MTWPHCSSHPLCEGPHPGQELCIYCRDVEYDAERDFAGSIDEAYRVIRARKAAGGRGWKAGEGM